MQWKIILEELRVKGDFLVWETKEIFANARIINVIEKKFKDLDEKDMDIPISYNTLTYMYFSKQLHYVIIIYSSYLNRY